MRGTGGLRAAVGALAVALGVAVVAGCSGPLAPGNDETDRIAQVVSTAISHPRQESAAGFARAALATRAGRDGRLRVVGMEELQADELTDPLARLTFLVHLEGSEAGFTTIPPVTACYEAAFNYYGVIGSPRRIACPEDAAPITPPPAPPEPKVVIPDGADELLERVLARASPTPRAGEVQAALGQALARAGPGAAAGGGQVLAAPEVATDGGDIGVALAASDRECLLGARVAGEVLVWRPSRVQLQPGELSCDPGTALARQGTRSPH